MKKSDNLLFKKFQKFAPLLVFFLVISIGIIGGGHYKVFFHEYPCCWAESEDGFMVASVAQEIRDHGIGVSTKMPSYLSNEDSYSHYPPLALITIGYLSKMTGAETYKVAYILSLIALIFTVYLVYIMIKKAFGEVAGFFSLPLSSLIFFHPFSYLLLTGQFLDIIGMFLLFVSVLVIERYGKGIFFIFLSFLIFSILINVHMEYLYLLALFTGYTLWGMVFNRKEWKHFIVRYGFFIGGGILAVIFNYGLITRLFLLQQSFNPFPEIFIAEFLMAKPIRFFMHFTPLFVFFVIWGFLKYFLDRRKISNFLQFAAISFAFFPLSFLFYYYRWFEIIAFLPFLFAPLGGLGVEYIYNKLFNIGSYAYRWMMVLLLLSVMLFAIEPNQAINISEELVGEWEGMQWIKNNTPEGSSVLYLYPLNNYPHTFYWQGGREPYRASYFDVFNSETNFTEYSYKKAMQAFDFAYIRNGFGYDRITLTGQKKFCDIDYVFVKFTSSYSLLCLKGGTRVVPQLPFITEKTIVFANNEVVINKNGC